MSSFSQSLRRPHTRRCRLWAGRLQLALLGWSWGLRGCRFLSFKLACWSVPWGLFCWAPWLVVCLVPALLSVCVCVCLCVFSLCLLGCVCCLVFLFALAALASSFLVGLARSGACATLRLFMYQSIVP
jgi:hypothetical protein